MNDQTHTIAHIQKLPQSTNIILKYINRLSLDSKKFELKVIFY